MPTLPSVLRVVALAVAAGALAAAAAATVWPGFRETLGPLTFSVDAADVAGLPWWGRTLTLGVPALAFAYSMIQLAALLQLAARQQVFTARAALHLRRSGVWLLVASVSGEILSPFTQALHLWAADVSHGEISVALTSDDLWNVFLGALFMLVARVLSDAYRIAEENRQFI